MSTTDLCQVQTATPAVATRPDAAIARTVAPVCTGAAAYGKAVIGNATTRSWLATSRLSMTVPAFHDRRPLCSTT